MQITLLDLIIAWFSKIWERIEELKKSSPFTLLTYIAGVIGFVLLVPSLYLLSWVIDRNIFDIKSLESIRIFVAVSIIGVFWYFMGGALALYFYRQEDKKENR